MPLLKPPVLDSRDDARLTAEAIARTHGGLTAEYLRQEQRVIAELIPLVETGLAEPTCPEMTNANHSSPSVVLLEGCGWLARQVQRVHNTLPSNVRIEFANLFVEPRAATAATTTLLFTASGNTPVTIPAGTEVTNEEGTIVFVTDDELVIVNPSVLAEGVVTATRSVIGFLRLAPNMINKLAAPIEGVESVTNSVQIESGSEAETLEQSLSRAQRYVRYGERLVSHEDVEDAIFDNILFGRGIIKAFPLYQFPDMVNRKPGYVTLVVMTESGEAISDEVRQKIGRLLDQKIGHILFEVIGPQYDEFDIEATITVSGSMSSDAARLAIETDLRALYTPSLSLFGKRISRAEIIQHIENQPGVTISSDEDGPILIKPVADKPVATWAMPKLVNVILTIQQ